MSRTENLTVMFTDIVNFTERTSRQSRADTEAMLREHDRLLLPLIGRFGGRRVKSIGDALLVTFRSPTDAVRCGMAMQDTLAEYNAGRPDDAQIHIRVALNVGEVRVDRRDVFGEAVNVASRVEQLTPPDQIYFTEAVYLAMNKAEVPSAVVGVQQLRGVPEPVKLFHVPARKINRLVPGGEELAELPGELPFGGVHRRAPPPTGLAAALAVLRTRTARWSPRFWNHQELLRLPPRARLLPLAGLLGATLALAWLLNATESASPPRAVAEADAAPIQAAAPATDTGGVRSPADARRDEAISLLQRGHRAFENDQRREAVEHYARALQRLPELHDDPLLARRLVACLSWASDLATPLIRAHASPAVIAALAARTAELGTRGAARAAELLRELGHAERIAPVLTATNDLAQSQSCEGKLDAIRRLRQLGDPRALPALRESLGSGLRAWFKTSCYRSEAQAAIKDLERLQSPAPG
ncbi:adenylate/guanylate cyclase domain-containing protein [Fontimonas sp. SYSU GA230001]|uniref:adenylate/guanylate cyclase domain-containing protein n=1 Tax=Fontimonas sp. SYSU GA230001 TaxID=3142450 RepID=UPI0032B4F351